MEKFYIFKSLAIIIIAAKIFGLGARKLKAPQVAGEIVAGILVGPSVLGLVQYSDFLGQMAEIGVILLMFTAGLETRISELKKTGVKALLIACAGVFVPLVLGALLYFGFYGMAPWGSEDFYKGVFIGLILTATSVGITVEALKELGKLSDTIGTTLMSAAIIDDVIGIVVLTIVIGFRDPTQDVGHTLLMTGLFFVTSIVCGYIIYRLFKIYDRKHRHTRRIPIIGLALCFAMSFAAERYFGVADITGAYIAGVILSSLKDSTYISRKMDINSYMIFGPVFFASIGIQNDLSTFNTSILLFSLAFVLVGMGAKVIGCGTMARLTGFNRRDALKIGCGMMTRGEVALIVAQRGFTLGVLDSSYSTSVILLIIVSSIVTPILLKLLYNEKK
ncbi:Kef-type K+ transport system, membrane component KefB [Ruminococcaceae bacterium YRB3002]|nr:Kef-type K+ transport system, membrane component KefB [Ruminococcaceae bacterium YRB3002]